MIIYNKKYGIVIAYILINNIGKEGGLNEKLYKAVKNR